MRIYGLTGGIASGKSTVAGMLRGLGATVIDADEIAREVTAPGTPAWQEIRQHWPQVVLPDGQIDRRKLGEIVFSDAAARLDLGEITHARIGERSAALAQQAGERGEQVVFYEAALLVESGLAGQFAGLIVVSCPPETQQMRLQVRDGVDVAGARARMASQLPLAHKLKAATHVVDNSGPVEQTRAAVTALWRELSGRAGGPAR